MCVPPSVLGSQKNLTTKLVHACKLISIITKLINKKWLFLGDACPEKKKQDWSFKLDCERVCLGAKHKKCLQE